MNDYPPNIAIRSLKNDTSLKSILVKRVPGDLGKKPAGEIFKTSSEESKSNEDNSCQGYNSDLEINYDQLQADCEDDYDALSLNLDEEVQNFEVHKEAIPALSLPDVEMAKWVKHHKPIEAFWNEDFEILWIDCILEDGYQARDIISLKKAIENEHDKLQNATRKSHTIEQGLVTTKKKIEKYQMDLSLSQNELIRNVESIYDSVIEKLIQRKQQLVKDIKTAHDDEQARWGVKLSEINTQVKRINELKVITFNECKQSLETILTNCTQNVNETKWCQSAACIPSLANAKKYNELISDWLVQNASFSTKFPFKPVHK